MATKSKEVSNESPVLKHTDLGIAASPYPHRFPPRLLTPRRGRQAALSKKAQIHAVDYSGRLTTTTLSHFDERPKQARRSASRPRGGGGRRLGLAAL